MRRSLVLALLLALLAQLLPTVGAGVPFERAYEDPTGDTAAPSVDVVRVVSSVEDGLVTQRIEMAAPPDEERDTLIVRSWFHNSTGGSFHVVDLEIHAWAAEDEKFRAIVRQGDFENITPIDAEWEVDGNAWVFTFDESIVADATCFDPIVWAQHEPEGAPWSTDVGGIGTRHCRVRGDPAPGEGGARPGPGPGPGIEAGFPQSSSPPPDPPGSYAPSPTGGILLACLAAAALLTRRTWRRS